MVEFNRKADLIIFYRGGVKTGHADCDILRREVGDGHKLKDVYIWLTNNQRRPDNATFGILIQGNKSNSTSTNNKALRSIVLWGRRQGSRKKDSFIKKTS